MKRIPNTAEQRFLGAFDYPPPCTVARRWIGRKSFKSAWNQCPKGAWMYWFVTRLTDRGYLDSHWHYKVRTVVERAPKNMRHMTPAQRVREVMPYEVIYEAYRKYKEELK